MKKPPAAASRSTRAGKPVSASVMEMTTIVLPEDTNKFGNLFGGRLMEWIDKAAAVAALRHARMNVVTASLDSLDFLSPIGLGGIVRLVASVNMVHRTSMEVGVKVVFEDALSGKLEHTCTAYLTLIGMDSRGRPSPVPHLLLKTSEERRRNRDAGKRRELRLGRRLPRARKGRKRRSKN